ncbi:MAG: McrC family protein [Saprospiraceae bacterium]|nr:McrC family protein [Saprospiraceae bacterium]
MMALVEHGTAVLPENLDIRQLESYLAQVWESRVHAGNTLPERELEEVNNDTAFYQQPFFYFGPTRQVKARNYVGFVQFGEHSLEIQPKIFAQRPDLDAAARVRHLIHWLSYGQRTWFPFSEADLDETAVDSFPEALLYVFGRQTLHLVLAQPSAQYQIVEEALPYFRGRLLTDAYIKNWAQGQQHVVPSEHSSFQYDNLLNRIIKFVTRKLLTITRLPETMGLLRNILFVLDEVADEPLLTRADCDRVSLNRYFGDYSRCLDRCRLFLSDTAHQSGTESLPQLCFLVPMERVFEDFLAEFMRENFSDRFQIAISSTDFLASNQDKRPVFQIRNDLLLKSGNDTQLIIDFKYKNFDPSAADDPKRGISQPDLYQMLAYALRRNCAQVLLLYPGFSATPLAFDEPPVYFTIESDFFPEKSVRIAAARVDITSTSFEQLRNGLRARLDYLTTILHA